MLDLLHKKKRILNIDQTWISDTNFVYKKWRKRGYSNSLDENIVNPRISVIAAIDTEGDMYMSLTQVNTNTEIMKMYLTYLAEQLDRDRPDWRSDTVILLDGAQYHINEEMFRHFTKLQMQVIFTGPRSYDACPCEMLFAHLKSVNMNPQGLPTGKK